MTNCTKQDLPEDIRVAIRSAHAKKAFDVVVLDLRGQGAFTDFFLLCSANGERQVKAIVDAITSQLRSRQTRPSHIEGYERAEWVLIDYFDVVVHVFISGTRSFYDLERLWGAAKRIECRE